MKLYIANKIIKNTAFRSRLTKIEELEKDRIFCGHGLDHLLTVARLTILICQERGIYADPDIVYSAALLHDIGRVEEYTLGLPHETAGAEAAEEILSGIGCGEEEAAEIIRLILSHRKRSTERGTLEAAFYEADKKSRTCSFCKAQELCNWPEDKKNMNIEV
ncbi:MAG: HD domain-containing protein [Ruminococcus sp.]|nr:HD domain-containing protein [Ruminococcus sp.]